MTVDNPEEAERPAGEYPEYPWIEEIFEETAMLRQRPKEVLGMFSEALKILDRNTVTYMIEELKRELEETKEEAKAEAERAKAGMEERDAEIAELKRQLEYYKKG